MIQIKNEKYVDTINIHSIFLYTLLDVAPNVYGPQVTTDSKVIKKLIIQFMNAINGPMVSSLLYYCTFCKTLKLNKSKMNPYDPCVSNHMVNVLQQSKLFHVDDFKLIHKDNKVDYSFI